MRAAEWSKALGNNANLSVLWPLWVAAIVAIQAALGAQFANVQVKTWKEINRPQ